MLPKLRIILIATFNVTVAIIVTLAVCTAIGAAPFVLGAAIVRALPPVSRVRDAESSPSTAGASSAYLQREVDFWFEQYRTACGDAVYPSSDCPAWYSIASEGDYGEPMVIHDGAEDWRDEHPCFAGQVKADRRSGIFYLPGHREYAETRDDVVCYDRIVTAISDGYHLPEG